MNVAIIGLGKMGLSHAALVGAHPLVKQMHACDTNKLIQSGLKKYSDGILFHNDYVKMIESYDLDAAVVATPTIMHHKVVKECLNKKIPVFCEKPFCFSPEDSIQLANSYNELSITNQVGYHNKFLGTFTELKRLLNIKILGKLFHFSGDSYGPVVVRKKSKTWRTSSNQCGGCLPDYAAHVINLIQSTLGTIKSARGTLMKKIWSQEVEDAVYTNLILESGLSGTLSVNWSDETYRKMSTSITLQGELGKIICDATELKIFLNSKNEKENLPKGWTIKYINELTKPVWFNLRGEEYSSQMDYFLSNVNNSKMGSLNTFLQGAETNKIMNKISEDNYYG